jgi:hypothetical protein
VEHRPAIAYAVRCLTIFDKLELTIELLKQADWPDFDTLKPSVAAKRDPFRSRAWKTPGPRSF